MTKFEKCVGYLYGKMVWLEPTFSPYKHPNISQTYSSHLPAYEDGTEYSETSAYKIQTQWNYLEESI